VIFTTSTRSLVPTVLKRAIAWAQTVIRNWRNSDLLKLRQEVEVQFTTFVEMAGEVPVARRVLVDGMFDNPGYWYRLTIFRAALGLDRAHEIGLTGVHSVVSSRKTLNRLGINEVVAFDSLNDSSHTLREDAKKLAASIKYPEDILELKLPHGLPPSFLYDAILKRQKTAIVDVSDPQLEGDVYEFISAIRSAERAIELFDPDIVCLSHQINARHSALAWLSAQEGRNPVVLFGNYGVPRLARIKQPEDISDCLDRPGNQGINALSPGQADGMEKIGREYLKLRFQGKTTDLGGLYAFSQPNSNAMSDHLLAELGWQNDKPIVAVYASNWFDFPHSNGMSEFRDFLDWILATLEAATNNRDVNWLFKSHPCDKWYGGLTLKDMMPSLLAPHIRMVPEHWSGRDTMLVTNALVTYHGTAALEYAAMGKPVLVADRGWYHDCGFVVWARSREEYLNLLASPWFDNLNIETFSHRSAIFTGWYFCTPEWQRNGVLPDDSTQLNMYPALLRQLNDYRDVMDMEVQTIRSWYESGEPFYHTYKMQQADQYRLSNIA
jgi:hypothetical protein